MQSMTRRQEIVWVKGQPVEVTHLCGHSSLTAQYVVRRMEGLELGHAGLGGTSAHNINSSDYYAGSAEAKRIYDHGESEFRFHQLQSVFIVNSDDQATELREQGNEFRRDHDLCRIPSIESDYAVALERAGLPKGTFANVNRYGANVAVSKLLP
jgi:hypothetical protein